MKSLLVQAQHSHITMREKQNLENEYRYLLIQLTRSCNNRANTILKLTETSIMPNGKHNYDVFRNCNDHTIYILMSMHSQKYYLGRTKSIQTREYQHRLDAKRCQMKIARPEQKTLLHTFMSHTKPNSWIIVPIFSNISETKICTFEKHMIQAYTPSLNTQFIPDHYKSIPNNYRERYKHNEWTHLHKIRHRNRRIRPQRLHRKARLLRQAQNQQQYNNTRGLTIYKLERYETTKPSQPIESNSDYDLKHLITSMDNKYHDSQTQQKDTHYTISWTRKQHDITNFKTLTFQYGQSTVSQKQPNNRGTVYQYNLKEKLTSIKKAPRGKIRLWNITRHKKYRHIPDTILKKLQLIIKHQNTRNKIKKYILQDDLINMIRYVKNLPNKRERKIARNFIHTTLRDKYKITLNKELVVKIPYTMELPMKQIISIISKIIQQSDLHPYLKKVYTSKVRIVNTKRPTIQEMFSNHIPYIRKYQFDIENRATCICNTFDPDNTLPRDKNGHISCKVSQANDEIKKVLNISAKNIARPTQSNITQELTTSIIELTDQINNMMSIKSRLQHRKRLKHIHLNCKDKLQRTLIKKTKLIGINTTLLREIQHAIHETSTISKAHRETEDVPISLNTTELENLKQKYQHFIFSPLDKNNGCMHMA